MPSSPRRIVSVGYEGRTLGQFVDELLLHEVDVVVDVRLTPISRKPGFSKRALEAALADHGIEYVHEPGLGNPKENRAAFHEDDPAGRAAYRRRLGGVDARAAMARLVELATTRHVGVVCFERSARRCHRDVVLEHALRARSGLAVIEA